jgi:choline transport protein
VPRAMVGGYILNGVLGFAVLLVYLFGITSIDDALNEPNGYPFLWVFGQAVSPGGVIGLTMLPLAVVFGSTISLNLTTSRQTWAFARDKGLPFSNWLSRVDPKVEVPANAIVFTCTCTVLLSLINIGSSAAFNAIISLNLVSLMLSYSLSIGCVLTRRISHPERLPHCRWSLGRWGVPVNAGGLAYSTFAFFWSFWPNATPVDLVSFNWAVVMFVGVVLICMVDYWVRGRKAFTGPVVLVEGWRTE